jgi:hypothetical protein
LRRAGRIKDLARVGTVRGTEPKTVKEQNDLRNKTQTGKDPEQNCYFKSMGTG